LALERQSIEKKDFPIGRRGYDPDAVDAHLTALATEIDELKRSSRRRSETLASSASEQVRAIVEAAETSAAEIQREAEEEAREIKLEATSEAKATKDQASAQAREYVSKVSEATAVMQQRLDAMDSELGALIESLRTGSNRLGADLSLLEGNLSEVREAAQPRPRFEPEPDFAPPPPPRAAAPPPPPVAAPAPPAPAAAAPAEVYEDDELYDDEYDDDAAPAAEGADDTEGARLIALNMALNNVSREETDRYLAENFTLTDRAGLLDEVYASVQG
jgi:DivIVA domain-containing protein